MTHLYRHFGKDGSLLYVGVSLSAVQRLAQHRSNAHWFEQIKRVEMETFETRQAVLDAEHAAIINTPRIPPATRI
jgi:predicted GIY-YIG superfamily endonuclease